VIVEMRKHVQAPVDTVGCEMLGDRSAAPKVFRFQTLVSLMLSSQTKDAITAAAIRRLQAAFPPYGFSVDHIANITENELTELIQGVSFQNKKVIYLKKTAKILQEQYNSDIPKTIEELCMLPGVGPKMSYLCMQHAWGTMCGIGVDIHVHRTTNRLGWVKTKTPEQTRSSLQAWLPKEHWSTINKLLVGFGQQVCKAKPLCGECKVRPYCAFGRNKNFTDKNIQKKTKRKEKKKRKKQKEKQQEGNSSDNKYANSLESSEKREQEDGVSEKTNKVEERVKVRVQENTNSKTSKKKKALTSEGSQVKVEGDNEVVRKTESHTKRKLKNSSNGHKSPYFKS